MGIPDHLICLLRNLYAGQEAIVRIECGTTDWFQIEKVVHQGCILSPCLFNINAESVSQFSRSVVSDSLRPHGLQHTRLPCPSPTPGFTQSHVHQVGDAIQRSHPLPSPSPLAPNPSQHQGLFQKSTLCMRWPKYWSLSFSISPTNEHPGLISFRMDWLDLLAVQRTLKSLLQHHSSKASILQHSAFFTVQLSHPCMTTGKTMAFTRRAFVGKVMSLLFNMLSRLVITFLPRSKHLLISWLQSPSAVNFEPKKINSDTVSNVSPSISYEVIGPDAMILVF